MTKTRHWRVLPRSTLASARLPTQPTKITRVAMRLAMRLWPIGRSLSTPQLLGFPQMKLRAELGEQHEQ